MRAPKRGAMHPENDSYYLIFVFRSVENLKVGFVYYCESDIGGHAFGVTCHALDLCDLFKYNHLTHSSFQSK
jgi:hypothetical protein